MSFWPSIRRVFLLSFSVLFLFGFTRTVFADDLGIAQPLTISGDSIPDGAIVSSGNNTYHLSSEPYDKSMFGVVSASPAIELQYTDNTTTHPVITAGIVPVLVNGENGPIHTGDMITSSSKPGIGMKAVKTGFILGVAQEDWTPTAGEPTGTISVSLDIKLAFGQDSPASEKIGTRLLDVLKLSSFAITEQPSVVFRYVVAAIVMIGGLIFAFFSFARVAHKGTEALGRNPLASKHILMGMLTNAILSAAILGSGLAAAYLIMRY